MQCGIEWLWFFTRSSSIKSWTVSSLGGRRKHTCMACSVKSPSLSMFSTARRLKDPLPCAAWARKLHLKAWKWLSNYACSPFTVQFALLSIRCICPRSLSAPVGLLLFDFLLDPIAQTLQSRTLSFSSGILAPMPSSLNQESMIPNSLTNRSRLVPRKV